MLYPPEISPLSTPSQSFKLRTLFIPTNFYLYFRSSPNANESNAVSAVWNGPGNASAFYATTASQSSRASEKGWLIFRNMVTFRLCIIKKSSVSKEGLIGLTSLKLSNFFTHQSNFIFRLPTFPRAKNCGSRRRPAKASPTTTMQFQERPSGRNPKMRLFWSNPNCRSWSRMRRKRSARLSPNKVSFWLSFLA